MATNKQSIVAKRNIKKAQKVWREMTPRERALSQPAGRKREKPGTKGGGDWYRVEVRPKEEFSTFRYHDIGKKNGDLERLAGKRPSGTWATQAWLVNKKAAHVEGKKLVADTENVRKLLGNLGSEPKHIKGDVFEAKDRPNVPEKAKPTKAQKRARMENIQKAQQVHQSGVAS